MAASSWLTSWKSRTNTNLATISRWRRTRRAPGRSSKSRPSLERSFARLQIWPRCFRRISTILIASTRESTHRFLKGAKLLKSLQKLLQLNTLGLARNLTTYKSWSLATQKSPSSATFTSEWVTWSVWQVNWQSTRALWSMIPLMGSSNTSESKPGQVLKRLSSWSRDLSLSMNRPKRSLTLKNFVCLRNKTTSYGKLRTQPWSRRYTEWGTSGKRQSNSSFQERVRRCRSFLTKVITSSNSCSTKCEEW